ncbi:ventrally expressed dharma/bozozok antagonist [Polyodon spathula]|uniref:ventrally expressed dharma/bozozok antagonist n=1 Tax=Polyodon spathula TaxID=7913 RepID=UPI001B7EA0A7|nr:ventrally expressed dharma/bozozok antagonist [Polyodon spathula]
MKRLFCVEWLSQSSDRPPCPALPAPQEGPLPGTPQESLPGFYAKVGAGLCAQQQPPQSRADSDTPLQSPGFTTGQKNRLSTAAVSDAGSVSSADETSGYESEGCRSVSPVYPLSPPKQGSPGPGGDARSEPPGGPGRRPRTAFTAEQINRLERTFKKQSYVGTREKEELRKKLNLSEKQIKNWFQNRRMKLKRTLQDALAQACHAKVASQLMHYPELQAYGPGPFAGYYPAQDGTAAYLSAMQYQAPLLSALPALPMETAVYPYAVPSGVVIPATSAGPGNGNMIRRYHQYAPYY